MPKYDRFETHLPMSLFTVLQHTEEPSQTKDTRRQEIVTSHSPSTSTTSTGTTASVTTREGSNPDSYHTRFARTLSDSTNTSQRAFSTSSSETASTSSKSTRQTERNAAKLAQSSPFRPPVSAAKRLATWTSPYARRNKDSLSSHLPTSLVSRTFQAVEEAITPSTRSAYGAGLLRFHQFCDTFEISEEDRMPASAPLLAAFVAHCKGSYEGKTISSWLSGIRYWHVINRAPWNGEDNWVNQTRASARKEGTHHRRPRRAPVSLSHLHTLLESLDISKPYDAAAWATTLTTFFGCRRLGETTVKSAATFDPAYNVLRSATINFRYGSVPGSSSIDIAIPWTKTTKQEGAVIVLTSRTDVLCPVKALLNHLAVNANCPPHLSLFAYRTETGWSHMIKEAYLKKAESVWALASLEKVSGHSLRIGGATALLLAGVPPETVAKTGGWSSLAFLLYWRRVEEIIPLCTSQAYAKGDLQGVSRTMEQFRIAHGVARDADAE
ncbi:hypothetical protein CVT24_012718 [Panaeolus cyanescens]|uniref:Core-binding (CB) domain-containing protein n=1 Tax=Panaeolus cyanescens TaxID=181874 RepID=A0A409W6N0_9AGAR|nr:hypothetical protein CVT24_012718 [Panaeolus cyanescens]